MPGIHDDYDVCIVGSGAGGSVTAYELARSGYRVLVLEAGRRSVGHHDFDTSQGGRERALVNSSDIDTALVGDPWTACALGGGLGFYAGIAFRYRVHDFDARHVVAPEALDPAWPISYEDLRACYDEVERLVGVARAGGADPTEPPSAPPVLPPHPYSPQARRLHDAAAALGLRPYPTPLAITSQPYRGWPACRRLTECNGVPCPSGAKADAVSRFLDPTHHRDGVPPEVRTGVTAVRLVQSRTSRVDGVEWVDAGRRCRGVTTSRVVVVAANAVQTAALLLRSRSRHAPRGVGNGRDLVGRGLSFKLSGYVRGRVDGAGDLARNRPGPYSTLSLSDWYLDPDCPSGSGGMVYDAQPSATAEPCRGVLRLHYVAADQPLRENRVRLSTRRNALGLPYVRLDYRVHPLDALRARFLRDRLVDVLHEAGARSVADEDSHYEIGSSHLHGTCRAGHDPADSVVDRDGRVHDLDNLWVADGSYLPYAGGVNPTLTIQANALRIARRVAAALSARRPDRNRQEERADE